MLASEFSETCTMYEGFQVWEIENMEAFFKGNEILATIFKDQYQFPISEFVEKRGEIQQSDYEIMESLLRLVDDKTFFIFTLHDKNHLELIAMQKMKVMNFGMDIEKIKNDCVYAMIMDKKK